MMVMMRMLRWFSEVKLFRIDLNWFSTFRADLVGFSLDEFTETVFMENMSTSNFFAFCDFR